MKVSGTPDALTLTPDHELDREYLVALATAFREGGQVAANPATRGVTMNVDPSIPQEKQA